MSSIAMRHDRTARLEPFAALSLEKRADVFGARVVIAVGPSVLGMHVGRVLFETVLELLQRTVHEVLVQVAPAALDLEHALADEIVGRLADVGGIRPRVIPWDSHPPIALCVALGDAQPVGCEHFLGVGADGWRGIVTRDAVAVVDDSSWPFGACAAAALAQAAVVQQLLATVSDRPPIGPLDAVGIATIDFAEWTTEADAPRYPPPPTPVTLPPVTAVGAGAVGHAMAWVLARAPVQGTLAWFEDGRLDETSLNRCLGAARSDLDRPKLEVIARHLAGSGVRISAVHERWTTAQPLTSTVISAVDQNATRHDLQKMLPSVLISGETYDACAAVSRHVVGNGQACLVCRHPRRETGAAKRQPLTLDEAVLQFALPASVFADGIWNGARVLTPALAEHLAARAPDQAAAIRAAATTGADLCGTLGQLRDAYGHDPEVPIAASFGASSLLAGVGVVAALVREATVSVGLPLAIFEIDLFGPVVQSSQPGHRTVTRSVDCPACGEMAQRARR